MPLFTIGIPTYNRAGLLRHAIEAALDQSWPDVEVIVSDNASTDDTQEVVRSFGDRVRYHRNAENIGPWPNFARLPEMANGEYFSWLQDDDMLHCDFARRAVEAIESDRNIVMYSAYAVFSPSYDTFRMPQIYGPPVPMDWMHSRLRVIDGFLVVPLSFFASFSISPVTAYRTEAIRRAVEGIDPAHLLHIERLIQARAVADGRVAVDPWPAGIFYKHEAQGHLLAGHHDVAERSRQWVRMADELCRLLEERQDRDWRPSLCAWLEALSLEDRIEILNVYLPPRQYWSLAHPLAQEVCSQILDRVPKGALREHSPAVTNGRDFRSSLKEFGRQLTPPLVWNMLGRVKGSLNAGPK